MESAMSRPRDDENHTCIYCQKSRLYGPMRHTSKNDTNGGRVVTCRACQKLRTKKNYSHEAMLDCMLRRAQQHLDLMKSHMQSLATQRTGYSDEFRLKHGAESTKIEVGAKQSAAPPRYSIDKMIAELGGDWDEPE
jgi:Zn-finger protein